MQNSNKRSVTSLNKSVDWLNFIDNYLPRLVVPVGPVFQASVPEWTGPLNEASLSLSNDLDTTRWFGTRVWPIQDENLLSGGDKVGKGRSDSCNCSSPGSAQCVICHISEARTKLQFDVGPAFWSWKFDEMGEDVGKSWTSKQKTEFDQLVKVNLLSEGMSFLQPAEICFLYKTRKDIVSYYLNVYVPKRIRMLTKSGCKVLDSDDDEVEEPCNIQKSLKRLRPNHVDITQLVRSHYLTGRR